MAKSYNDLLPTTVEKDYVLGWLLAAISADPVFSRWLFKGGTCLKKCFFETYRFSEDLDFTVPTEEALDEASILDGLSRIAEWVEQRCGVSFPRERIAVEGYDNKRGNKSYQAKIFYSGPLRMSGGRQQRVKFDITQDEVVVGDPDFRDVHHPYDDELPATPVRTYCLEDVVAEKTRALVERQGRARDVYDLVHLSRSFRELIDPRKAVAFTRLKFSFKGLAEPNVDKILSCIDEQTLEANWKDQLAHQLPVLPPVETFLADLRAALSWWLQPEALTAQPKPISAKPSERPEPRVFFPGPRLASGRQKAMDTVRFAARNRLCVEVLYHRSSRLVEPYSLRRRGTGNLLLYVHERTKAGFTVNETRSYKVDEIESVRLSTVPFDARYTVEL